MTTITRNALVPYSARQMFELVNGIEDYPRFLPWCSKSTVTSRTDEQVEATLEIAWSGIHKNFSTRNFLHPYEKIELTLISGPFKRLEGRWSFNSLGEEGCKVHLDLEFEFAGHWMDILFQPVFNHIANSLVDVFCKRAAEVYGGL